MLLEYCLMVTDTRQLLDSYFGYDASFFLFGISGDLELRTACRVLVIMLIEQLMQKDPF